MKFSLVFHLVMFSSKDHWTRIQPQTRLAVWPSEVTFFMAFFHLWNIYIYFISFNPHTTHYLDGIYVKCWEYCLKHRQHLDKLLQPLVSSLVSDKIFCPSGPQFSHLEYMRVVLDHLMSHPALNVLRNKTSQTWTLMKHCPYSDPSTLKKISSKAHTRDY